MLALNRRSLSMDLYQVSILVLIVRDLYCQLHLWSFVLTSSYPPIEP